MAMTHAERQKKYRECHGGDDSKRVVNVGISVTVVTELKRLCKEYGVNQRAMVERLILEGILLKEKERVSLGKIAERESLATEEVLEWLIYAERITDRAKELLDEHGTKKAAMAAYSEELRQDFPGYKQTKLKEFPVAYKLYSQMNGALSREAKRRKGVTETDTLEAD
jgi:hypothetical protein